MTRRSPFLVDAQIAFRCPPHRSVSCLVEHEVSLRVADIDHADVVIRAAAGAHATANTGVVVDDDFTSGLIAMYGGGRTTDHADRVRTVHASIGDHHVTKDGAMANETRIVVVGGGTRPDTFVTVNAALQIDHHRSGAVDESLLDEKLEQIVVSLFRRL